MKINKFLTALILLLAIIETCKGLKCYNCEHVDYKGAENAVGNDETCKNGNTPKNVVDCKDLNYVYERKYSNESDANFIAVQPKQNQARSYVCMKFSVDTKVEGNKLKYVRRTCAIKTGKEKIDGCEQVTLQEAPSGGFSIPNNIQITACGCEKDNCNSALSISFSILTVVICLIASIMKAF